MTKRLLYGKRGSDYGLWVSKSGADVTASGTGTEDMLFDSTAAETGGMILKTGSLTLAFSSGQPNATSSYVYYNLDGSNGALEFIPMILFSRVDGNKVYPFNTQHQWNNETPHPSNPASDPGTSQGVMWDSYADIYNDKFRVHASRWMQSGNYSAIQPSYFDTANNITFQYAVLAIGGATAE